MTMTAIRLAQTGLPADLSNRRAFIALLQDKRLLCFRARKPVAKIKATLQVVPVLFC